MAHKKGGGSTRNGRGSNAQFRGVKVYGGETINAGGIIVRQVREPAIQRLAGVAWFVSVAGAGGAVWLALYHAPGQPDAVTAVAVGAAVTLYAAALWLIRRSALQNLALFAGLVTTILGIADIITVPAGTGPAPAPAPNLPTPVLAIALPLWVSGLAWAGLGWRRYAGPPAGCRRRSTGSSRWHSRAPLSAKDPG